MTKTTAPKVFPAGEQKLAQFPFGDHADVTVWQGIGGTGTAEPIGAGFATYQGTFDWILQYDAVYYFLEGELEIAHDGATHTAGPGDVMFLPKGASVTYNSPDGCRIFWAIFPGNWEEISDFSIAERTAP